MPTEVPTEAAPEAPAEPEEGDAGVKVTGKLGEKPKIEVPERRSADRAGLQGHQGGQGHEAAAGQTVNVQYVGALFADGQEFDASWDRGGEPFSFPLGSGSVIPGWDQGLVGMKEGGRRVLIDPAGAGLRRRRLGPDPPERDARVRGRHGEDHLSVGSLGFAGRQHGAHQGAEQQAVQRSRGSMSRCATQSRQAPSMNHSQALTAVLSTGEARPCRR